MQLPKISLLAFVLPLAAALTASDADAQRRRVRHRGSPDWFTIVSEGGLCLDVHGAEAGRDGARVQMWTCHGGPNQLWRFEGATLVSAAGGCLDVHGGDLQQRSSARPLARVTTYACHGRTNQRWRPSPDGALVSDAGGCLDVEGGAIHQVGQRVISWPCHGGANQRFRIVPATPPSPPPPRPQVVLAPHAMDDASFAAFVQRIRAASFSADRVAVVRATAPHAWLTAAQIRAVLAEMSFSSERIEVLDLLVPRMVDRHNGAAIFEALPFSSERAHAERLLARTPR